MSSLQGVIPGVCALQAAPFPYPNSCGSWWTLQGQVFTACGTHLSPARCNECVSQDNDYATSIPTVSELSCCLNIMFGLFNYNVCCIKEVTGVYLFHSIIYLF